MKNGTCSVDGLCPSFDSRVWACSPSLWYIVVGFSEEGTVRGRQRTIIRICMIYMNTCGVPLLAVSNSTLLIQIQSLYVACKGLGGCVNRLWHAVKGLTCVAAENTFCCEENLKGLRCDIHMR